MRERHRFSHEIPEPSVNCLPAAENSDDDEDEEEEEERRHNEGEEEEDEEEEPVWTASGALAPQRRGPSKQECQALARRSFSPQNSSRCAQTSSA